MYRTICENILNANRDQQLYDLGQNSIRQWTAQRKSGDDLFFELAFEDLPQAADLFRPIYDSTHGIDGFVSLEVSPLLAYDTARTIKEAAQLHAQSKRPNVLIKIPGTPEGVPAIEESTCEGVPVNVTLLFSREQYIASAEAYMRHRAQNRLRPRSEDSFRGIRLHQPLGQSSDGEAPGAASEPSWNCDCKTHVRKQQRSAGVEPMAETCHQIVP
jgi:hypothetical protein